MKTRLLTVLVAAACATAILSAQFLHAEPVVGSSRADLIKQWGAPSGVTTLGSTEILMYPGGKSAEISGGKVVAIKPGAPADKPPAPKPATPAAQPVAPVTATGAAAAIFDRAKLLPFEDGTYVIGRYGNTPLHVIVNGESSASEVAVLVAEGWGINATNIFGQTPLHTAIEQAMGFFGSDGVLAIMTGGSDVNAKDIDESTPLHYAAIYNQSRIFEALLDKGADLFLSDRYGQTATDIVFEEKEWRHCYTSDVPLLAVACGKQTFVAVGGVPGSNALILTSQDGIEWTRRDSGISGPLLGVDFVNGKFRAGMARGGIAHSPDGVTWVQNVTDETSAQPLSHVSYASGAYVAIGPNGTILSSGDGEKWNKTGSVDGGAVGICRFRNKFFVLGAGGKLMQSANGADWTSSDLGTGRLALKDIRTLNDKLMIVGQNALILVSDDGTKWEESNTASLHTLNAVTHSSDSYVAVGNRGIYMVSQDAKDWKLRKTDGWDELNGVAHSAHVAVACGKRGIWIRKPSHSRGLNEIERLAVEISESAELLASRESSFKQFAERRLKTIGKPAVPELKRLMTDVKQPMSVRKSATRLLGFVGGDQAAALLLSEFSHRTSVVLDECVESLGRMGWQPAVDPIMRLLDDSDFNADLRKSCCAALGMLKDPHAVRMLMARCESDSDARVQDAAAAALDGMTGEKHGSDHKARMAWMKANRPDWLRLSPATFKPASQEGTRIMQLVGAGILVAMAIVWWWRRR